jgi:hypothetical protein
LKLKTRAPIIKELKYTKEAIAENEEPLTKRKELLHALLQGPMCSICAATPTKRIYYNLQGVTRIEAYCDEHFSIYERNKDVDINEIMEAYGCIRAPPGSFGGGKKEGYSKVAKSSIADRTIICSDAE